MTDKKAIEILENEMPRCGEKAVYSEGERCEAYDKAISALHAQQHPNALLTGWVSVKDRLPEIGVEVLICDISASNDFVDVWSLERDEEYDDVCWEDKNGNWYPLDEATHWISLPEPPKEANHEQ